jgi:hypothetical protein
MGQTERRGRGGGGWCDVDVFVGEKRLGAGMHQYVRVPFAFIVAGTYLVLLHMRGGDLCA